MVPYISLKLHYNQSYAITEKKTTCNDDMVDNNDYLETEKCCGSGCNNCVLDENKKSSSSSEAYAKANLLTVDGRKYLRFFLNQKSKCTKDIYRFQFQVNEDNIDFDLTELRIPPGNHIIIRAPVSDGDHPKKYRHDQLTEENFISRPYTPIYVDKSGGKFEILVKFEPNGLMSNYLRSCSVGDVVEVKGPYGPFEWTPNKAKHLYCFSQGVAIAPMFAIARSILDNEEDETWINFSSCFRSIKDILLRDELYDLQQYWNFQSSIYLSNETTCICNDERTKSCSCIRSQLKYNEVVCAFRLDEIELSKLFINRQIENSLTLICGTNSFINSIKMLLKKLLLIKDEQIIIFD